MKYEIKTMKSTLTAILLLILTSTFSQSFDFMDVINEVKSFPNAVQHSTHAVSNHIKQKFKSPEKQLKAAFFWTSHHISYSNEQYRKAPNYSSREQLISATMKSKQAVCQGYSEVFNEICTQLGFESYVIAGYTSQEEQTFPNTGHAWNTIKIDNEWFLFDPTWAAGHFLISASSQNRTRYIKSFSPKYFKVVPREFIKNHMPFDPLWQLTNNIINYKDFDQKKFNRKAAVQIDYQKIIDHLPYLTEKQKFKNSIERIKSMGKGNRITHKNLKNLERNLQIVLDNKEGEKYNKSLEIQLQAIELFNQYVDTYNKNRSNLSRIKSELQKYLKESVQSANQSLHLYNQISTTNSTLQLNIRIRKAELEKLFDKLAKEMETLDGL